MLKKSTIWSKNYQTYSQDTWSILVGEFVFEFWLVAKFISGKTNIFEIFDFEKLFSLGKKFETNPLF